MASAVVTVLAFMAVFLAVFAVNAVLLDLTRNERERLERQLDEKYRLQQRERIRNTPLPRELGPLVADVADDGPPPLPFSERLSIFVEQSGVETTVGVLSAWAAVLGFFVGVIVLMTIDGIWAGPAALVAAALPWLYISRKRSKRLAQLREQLADAFELMSRVIRAGQTVSQAMQSVADEFSRPISLEMHYCSEQMNLGLSAESALRDLARRTGLLELKVFSLAVLVHRQTGGNLAELLDKLAYVVRERFRIQGMIQSLTAQGRLQALILLSLPPAMFVLLMAVHPTYESLLFEYPLMILAALSLMLLGWLWIRKIVSFDY